MINAGEYFLSQMVGQLILIFFCTVISVLAKNNGHRNHRPNLHHGLFPTYWEKPKIFSYQFSAQ